MCCLMFSLLCSVLSFWKCFVHLQNIFCKQYWAPRWYFSMHTHTFQFGRGFYLYLEYWGCDLTFPQSVCSKSKFPHTHRFQLGKGFCFCLNLVSARPHPNSNIFSLSAINFYLARLPPMNSAMCDESMKYTTLVLLRGRPLQRVDATYILEPHWPCLANWPWTWSSSQPWCWSQTWTWPRPSVAKRPHSSGTVHQGARGDCLSQVGPLQ